MHINRDFPDTSDDEEESCHRYTYPYPIEDHYKAHTEEESDYYGEPPCNHCGVQFDHRNNCQDRPWHFYNEDDKIKFLTDKGLMHLYKAPAEDVNKDAIIEDIKMTEEIISCDICSTKVENSEFVIYKHKDENHGAS